MVDRVEDPLQLPSPDVIASFLHSLLAYVWWTDWGGDEFVDSPQILIHEKRRPVLLQKTHPAPTMRSEMKIQKSQTTLKS